MRTRRGFELAAVILLAAAGVGRADIIHYHTTLTGPAESPPNTSPGTGDATVIIDTAANTMEVIVTFSGLTSGTTASHIHAATALPGTGTAGVATTTPTFPGFPLGVTSGSYDQLFNLLSASSYNPAFVTANGGSVPASEAALLSALGSDRAYLNIHTTNFPSGEIRGFLLPQAAVPEPSSFTLLALGVGALAGWRRWRKRHAAAPFRS
ncbi:MAG TPA: CHRD domain-containing protein [Gemmataceae bacterium]|nr:CHRD domain-containing protein [Gemmataceae bacterium]